MLFRLEKQLIALLFAPLSVACFSSNDKPSPSGSGGAASCSALDTTEAEDAGAQEVNKETLMACLQLTSGSNTCLEHLYRVYLQTHTTREALAQLQTFVNEDATVGPLCHPVAHAIGRETFRIQKSVDKSFSACDLTCDSGCYHGAIERFLRGDSASCEAVHVSQTELEQKVATACPQSLGEVIRFQCLHGLGHALMYFSDYDLVGSLHLCDVNGQSWANNACYGGVFMENVVSSTPEKRDLSPTDYQYPCDSVDDKYRESCYGMQTSRMSEMGLTTAQLFEECRKAGTHQNICTESIGRDLSNDAVGGDPASAVAGCKLTSIQSELEACTRGVSHTLVADSQDGRYVFPFCNSFTTDAEIGYCFNDAVAYMKSTFFIDVQAIAADCEKYVPGVVACTAANGG